MADPDDGSGKHENMFDLASTLHKLAELLNVEIVEFFEGRPLRSRGVRGDEPGAVSTDALDVAVAQIQDIEVRRHLRGLLKVLRADRSG